MRLICPNCDAQYEVDPSLVPATGRDVQCSNCGKTWFQPPPKAEEADEPVAETAEEPEAPRESDADLEDEADAGLELDSAEDLETESWDEPAPADEADDAPEEQAEEAETTAPEPEEQSEPEEIAAAADVEDDASDDDAAAVEDEDVEGDDEVAAAPEVDTYPESEEPEPDDDAPEVPPEAAQRPLTRPGPDGREVSHDGLSDEAAEFFAKGVRHNEEEEDEAWKTGPRPDTETPWGSLQETFAGFNPSGSLADDDAVAEDEPAPASRPASRPMSRPPSRPRSAPVSRPRDRDEEVEDSDEPMAVSRPTTTPRAPVDPSVLGILRAEAEREIAARRADEALGRDPISALAEPDADSPAPSTRPSTRPEPSAIDSEEARRRAILPDIDDINATLTASSDRHDADLPESVAEEEVRRERAGFSIGFSAVLALCAILIGTYVFAPTLAEKIPGLAPVLSGYLDWANGMRIALDSFLQRTVDALSGS